MWTGLQLELADVCVSRGGRRLLGGLSRTLVSGQILALTGPNGVGKTSLLRALAGLAELDGGSLSTRLADKAVTHQPALCHLSGHADGLKGALTVRQNLAFYADYFGATGGVGIENALSRLRIERLIDLPVSVLSQGQKRRVALSRLLVAPRPIWLLDEPTASLDADATAHFVDAVTFHSQAGGLSIIATHNPLAIANLETLDLSEFAITEQSASAEGANSGASSEDYWLGSS